MCDSGLYIVINQILLLLRLIQSELYGSGESKKDLMLQLRCASQHKIAQ